MAWRENTASAWSYQKEFLFEFIDSLCKEFYVFSIRRKNSQIETYTNEFSNKYF